MQFKIGVSLLILAGAIPTFIGTRGYIRFLSRHPWERWYDVLVLGQKTQKNSNDVILMLLQVAYSNLMLTGFTLMGLAYFGIRNRIRWTWYLFILGAWPGLNDFVATLWRYVNDDGGFFPVPIFPVLIGAVGLILTRKEVFKTP
ncbi:MAG: hypothetical protein KDD61_04255 [Bdellovibrionales bacterium]|nr:hypothetical protein [Bdellovibrionales bacterium]